MILEYLNRFSSVIEKTVFTDSNGNESTHVEALSSMIAKFTELKKNKRIVYLVGNGGSSGIASHSSVDFLNACKMKAVTFTDSSQITCFANDYGYENVYAEPLKTMIEENDILIAISSSGKSVNILNSVKVAKQNGAFVMTFSGFKKDNPLRKLGDINLWLNVENYGIVEIGHALLLHLLTDQLIER